MGIPIEASEGVFPPIFLLRFEHRACSPPPLAVAVRKDGGFDEELIIEVPKMLLQHERGWGLDWQKSSFQPLLCLWVKEG